MVTSQDFEQPLKAVEGVGAQSFMLYFRGKGIRVGNTASASIQGGHLCTQRPELHRAALRFLWPCLLDLIIGVGSQAPSQELRRLSAHLSHHESTHRGII